MSPPQTARQRGGETHSEENARVYTEGGLAAKTRTSKPKGRPRMAVATDDHLSRPLLRLEVAFANLRRRRGVQERTVGYGRDEHQKMQLFLPTTPPRKLVFYVHGDGWGGGNPRSARFVGSFLAEEGYAVAILGYRPAPHAVFPAQLEDAFAALTVLLGMADDIGIEQHVLLAGFGSGAQLASLVALDAEQQARHCMPSETFAGLLSLGGLLDFSVCRDEQVCRHIRDLMGGRRGWDAADPVRRVRSDERLPTLVVHGAEDDLSPADAARAFVRELNAQQEQGPGRLVVVPGAKHDDLLRLFFERRPETEVVLDWLSQRAEEHPLPLAGSPELCLVGEAEAAPRRRKKKSSG